MSAAEKNREWARHFQDLWFERSGDPRLPYWLRVTALAYGRHGTNGHARFRQGEVSMILATVDENGIPQPYRNVQRAIRMAVEFGWLDDGSYWGCLIVPACAIRKGDWHSKQGACPLTQQHQKQTGHAA